MDVTAPLERGRVGIERGSDGGVTIVDVVRNLGALHIYDGVDVELTGLGSETYTVVPSDPATSRGVARRTATFRRGAWSVRIRTESVLTLEEDAWRLESSLEATEGEAVVFTRAWTATYSRGGV